MLATQKLFICIKLWEAAERSKVLIWIRRRVGIRNSLVLHMPYELPRSMRAILARVTSGFSATSENNFDQITKYLSTFFAKKKIYIYINISVQSHRLTWTITACPRRGLTKAFCTAFVASPAFCAIRTRC